MSIIQQGHTIKNILRGEIDVKNNWLCEKGVMKGAAILQLQRSAILTSVHIGNAHSAFVEVLVGLAADNTDKFESLVPMTSLMSPKDSMTGVNQNCTRLFNKSDFSQEAIGKAWDRIKVVCSQPFNKFVPFGLCFIRVQGEREKWEPLPKLGMKLLEEKKDDEIEIGSFFKKKRSSEAHKQNTGNESQKTPNQPSPSLTEENSQESDKMTQSTTNQSTGANDEKNKTNAKSPAAEKRKESLKEENKKKKQGGESRDKLKKLKEKKKECRKPFGKLMEDVVFVISGFQNPLRGNIRSLALEMGAKYFPDWNDRCTHLICACQNTPKFNQVKGKGKIVRKEWLEKCHADRKRYPWRRFALDKKCMDAPESEQEIEEETETSQASSSWEEETTPSKRLKVDVMLKEVKTVENSKISEEDEYGVSTDEDEEIDNEDTTDYPMPFLPNFLSKKIFYIDTNLKSKTLVERYIVAYDGTVVDNFDETVEFYVTDKGGAPLEAMKKKFPNMNAVKPSWISEMNRMQKCTPVEKHLVQW
ncbi:hypothetical protein RUM43_012716 [Polyplax serrata]|uniref:BRCT domain-containing protein n=1 Tax=Polyplax serrata TaxID=468196 RepID=A0AAN8PJH2_POLSC